MDRSDDLPALTKDTKGTVGQASALGNKARHAQYFTPQPVAEFMAEMFADHPNTQASVLDPGAGEGILGLTLSKQLAQSGVQASTTMVEIDEKLLQATKRAVGKDDKSGDVTLINGDFIKEAFLLLRRDERFSHVIMNPPYFKLQRNSAASDHLMSCGVNVTNIYAAFIWLGLMLLKDGGQLVAIVPRSFCNGPYFLKLREFVAQNASIEAIHTFSARDKVFSKDRVLQENVIVHFAKRAQSGAVRVTYSSDQSFIDVRRATFESSAVIDNDDPNLAISIPAYLSMVKLSDHACCSLEDVGLKVSTGPVVDFRLKESISINYFHIKKHGFGKELAYGLSAYLNSSLLDEHFRTFSGHTQVNATDLRSIPYPSEKQLKKIGCLALSKLAPIDTVVTHDALRECA
jgi:tRNA1(Val) A37 N6-methylase TrmN6